MASTLEVDQLQSLSTGRIVDVDDISVGAQSGIYLETVKKYGAVGDGSTDDTAAFNSAPDGVVVPAGTYNLVSALTGSKAMLCLEASFTGDGAPDSWIPAFGPAVIGAFVRDGSRNCIIGSVLNDQPSGHESYPTGVTGYGRVNNQGNTAFGGFFRADLYTTGGGVATTEINSFNFGSAPSGNLPPSRGFGTTEQHPICLTVAAGGTANSSIGIHIAKEGSTPAQFLTGIYLNYDSCVNNGIVVGAGSVAGQGPSNSMILQNQGSGVHLTMKTMGAQQNENAAFQLLSAGDNVMMSIKQTGKLSFQNGLSQATVGVAGAAAVLPSNPVGYLQVNIGDIVRVIPYYPAS